MSSPILINDPYLFLTSGCTSPWEGSDDDPIPATEIFDEEFVAFTRRQFEEAWSSTSYGNSHLFDHDYTTVMDQDMSDPFALGTIDLDSCWEFGIGGNLDSSGNEECKQQGLNNCSVPSVGFPMDPTDPVSGIGDNVISEELLYATIMGEDFINGKKLAEPAVLSPSDLDGSLVEQGIPEGSQSLVELFPEDGGDNDVTVTNVSVSSEATYENEVPPVENSRRRNHRKSNLGTRNQSVASPVFEYSNVKSEPPSSPEDFPKCNVGSKRQRKQSGVSINTDSGQEDRKSKRPKMYELDDPRAKNAKAAFANRQKKKEAMEGMKKENDKLREENDKIKQTLEEQKQMMEKIRKDLEYEQKKNLAATGLKRVVNSAKDVIESVLPALNNKFGRFELQVAPWFSKVDASIRETGTVDAALGGPMMTSKFITLHVNSSDRILRLDYRPEDPVLSENVPQ